MIYIQSTRKEDQGDSINFRIKAQLITSVLIKSAEIQFSSFVYVTKLKRKRRKKAWYSVSNPRRRQFTLCISFFRYRVVNSLY